MKKSSFLFALAALAAVLPAGALTVRSYPDALAKAGHKPIVLFCYGANYDEVSQKAYDVFIKQHKLQPALRSCVFVEVPIYQMPDDRQKKEMERIIGKRGLPGGIFSYPSLAVVDDGGNLRGIVQRADEMKDVDSAVSALTKLLEAYDRQEDLIIKAEKASGTRKAKLLMEASDVRGVNLPPDAGEGGRRNKAMKDNVGLEARKKFDPIVIMERTFNLPPTEVEGHIRSLLAQPGFSLTQRQEMLAALAGHIRRNGGSVDKLRALYTQMRDLDPDSMYGAYAKGALAMWVDKEPKASTADIPIEIQRSDDKIIDETTVTGTPGQGGTAGGDNNTAMGSRTNPEDTDEPEDGGEDDDSDFMGDDVTD